MTAFEDFLTKATTPGPDRLIPGCVCVAANKDGIVYSKTFGTQSVDPASSLVDTPLSLDTTMWIASCTKLLTAISIMQCVEKGLLNLDDDISTVLEQWKDKQILTGFDDSGEPILKKAEGGINLKMLLTHQSGLSYGFANSALEKYIEWRKRTGREKSRHVRDMCLVPLIFEPGTSWSYGVGIDWAGQMVERVNNNQSLGAYMEEHIWKPLGMKSTTFRLHERPDIVARRTDMTMRDADGKIIPSPTRFFPEDNPDDQGGGGLYSSAEDYIKVLIALLKNDGTLLKPESIDTLFTPFLTDAARDALRGVRTSQKEELEAEKDSWAMGGVVAPVDVDYALGGLVAVRDEEGGRKAGTLSWGGLPNLSWVCDRTAGIAFIYFSQLLPPGDKASKEILGLFEKAIYSKEIKALD